jgi:HEAT repeat protein
MALSAIGPEAIPMLTELLDHPWAEVRQASAMALARLFDRHAAETVPAASVDEAVSQLAVKLSDSETMVRGRHLSRSPAAP